MDESWKLDTLTLPPSPAPMQWFLPSRRSQQFNLIFSLLLRSSHTGVVVVVVCRRLRKGEGGGRKKRSVLAFAYGQAGRAGIPIGVIASLALFLASLPVRKGDDERPPPVVVEVPLLLCAPPPVEETGLREAVAVAVWSPLSQCHGGCRERRARERVFSPSSSSSIERELLER